SLQSDNLVGDLIIILAAAVFGIYTVRSRKLLDRYTPLQLSTLTMITGGLALVVAGIPSMVVLDYSNVSAGSWAGVFYSGVFSIGFAFIVWNYGILRVGAVRTATYQNLVPVMGLVFGFIILGEKLSLLQYGGSAIVIAGIVMARWKRKQ
ncbi:MAG: DMT family transporter, partial [Rhodothermaceae bacterium]|nr:DMT family transporter [Rhodothermaceae bacterium]